MGERRERECGKGPLKGFQRTGVDDNDTDVRKLCLLLLLAATAAAEVNEVRIPTGAGGVGFLPLLVMEKYQLIEKHAKPMQPCAGSNSEAPAS